MNKLARHAETTGFVYKSRSDDYVPGRFTAFDTSLPAVIERLVHAGYSVTSDEECYAGSRKLSNAFAISAGETRVGHVYEASGGLVHIVVYTAY